MKFRALLTAALALSLSPALAAPLMSIHWSDSVGDGSSVGDVVWAQLDFDSSGNWTATWHADAAHPFHGNARFNLNLFDTALGNLAAATAPQVSLDALHDFGGGSASEFSYGGQAAFLANWHVGDALSTGNGTHFLSGVVNLDNPSSRDNMRTQALVTGTVAEAPVLMLLAVSGMALLAAQHRRLRKQVVGRP